MAIKKVIYGVIVNVDPKKLASNQINLSLVDILTSVEIQNPGYFKSNKGGLIKNAMNGIIRDIVNLSVLLERMELVYQNTHTNLLKDKDMLWISCDIETYFMLLRSIADSLAIIICKSSRFSGQVPASFNKLKECILKHQDRIEKEFYNLFVNDDVSWFDELKDIRDNIIHHNANTIIYKNQNSYYFSINLGGKNIIKSTNKKDISPIFEYLKELTISVLHFMDSTAKAICAIFLNTDVLKSKKISETAVTGVTITSFKKLIMMD